MSKRRVVIFIACIALLLVAGVPAHAHKGHAGPKVVFVSARDFFKGLWPGKIRIFVRKAKLTTHKAEAVKKELSVHVSPGIYKYYRVVDKNTGKTIGVAMIREIEYKHGEMHVGIGIDPSGRIVGAALMDINKRYLWDVQDPVGTGFIKGLQGMEMKKLVSLSNTSDDVKRLVFGNLRDMGAILRAFLR